MLICNYFLSSCILARSGCLCIRLPHLNFCPLIYIANLAAIKIPGLLVNSLSLNSSTSHPGFASSDNSAMWCRCLVNPSKYVWGEHCVSYESTEWWFVSQEPRAHWGPVRSNNNWQAASSNKKKPDSPEPMNKSYTFPMSLSYDYMLSELL